MSSCLIGGGSTGYRPALGSATIFQRGEAKRAEVSILASEATSTTLTWYKPGVAAPQTISMWGSQSYADLSLGVVVNTNGPTAWCVHYK